VKGLTLLRTNYISALDCSDNTPTIELVGASSSAREPHQVSRMTWRFAGPTSGIVARAHSSLDSPRFDLAVVCRMRINVDDVLRELLKMS
jgi:hypothetical protein